MNPRSARSLAAAMLVAIVMVGLALLAAWHYRNIVPTGHDSLGHYLFAVETAGQIARDPAGLIDLLLTRPARYSPLPPVVHAASILLMSYSSGGVLLAVLFFAALTFGGLAVLGWQGTPSPLVAALPLAFLFAAPVFWEMGLSFNLEMPVLGGWLVVLAALLHADQLRSRATVGVAAVLAALLVQTKLVISLPVLPAALVLCFQGEPAVKLTRRIILGAMVASLTAWVLPHYHVIWDEFLVDFKGMPGEKFPGYGHYFYLLFIGYRGGPLVVALAAWLFVLWRRRALTRVDLALLLAFVAPFTFYEVITTKRDWYIFTAYAVLPVWYLAAASRLWETKTVRWVSYALVVFLSAAALVNLYLVGLVTFTSHNHGDVAGIRRPSPFPGLTLAQARAEMRAGQRGLVHGDTREANRYFALLLRSSPRYLNARLEFARRLSWLNEKEEAQRNWERILNTSNIDGQIGALDEIAELEAKGDVAPGTFDRYYQPLIVAYADQFPRNYSLVSAKVHACQRKRDWPGALATIATMRQIIKPKQKPGVNLVEAHVLAEMGRRDEARRLLTENLRTVSRHIPVLADSAGFLAVLWGQDENWPEAERCLTIAAEARHDPHSLATQTMNVARLMAEKGQIDRALKTLTNVSNELSGEPAALLMIEIAKIHLAAQRLDDAERVLQKALEHAEQLPTRQWITETLREIRSYYPAHPTTPLRQ